MYAKMIDGTLRFSPRAVVLNGMTVANPTAEQLTALGYLPAISTDAPVCDARHYARARWVQTDGTFRQVWDLFEIPNEPTEEERISALEGAVLALMGGGANV